MCSRTAHTLALFNLVSIPVPGEHFCFYGRFIQVPRQRVWGQTLPGAYVQLWRVSWVAVVNEMYGVFALLTSS